MAQDYDQYLHREWLGLLQPEGLVVSPPALVDAQAFVDKSKAIALQPVLQAIAQPELIKGTQVPIGGLWNGTYLRLVYSPSGESSGHVTFPIEAMTEVPGRTILGALEMLLGTERLFNTPTDKTLPKLLAASQNYQATVSNKLAEQVLDALWDLLRGFQAADAQRYDRERENEGGLQALAKKDPQHLYGGLLTTPMRLVFLLYAEDRLNDSWGHGFK